MWIFWTIVICAITIAALLWVSGLGYMKDNHPDYKGEDFLEEEKQEGWGDYVDEK